MPTIINSASRYNKNEDSLIEFPGGNRIDSEK